MAETLCRNKPTDVVPSSRDDIPGGCLDLSVSAHKFLSTDFAFAPCCKYVMNDFPYLLVRASTLLGTTLDVALLLDVEPLLVYRWIAGVDLPTEECIGQFSARLEPLLLSA